MVDKLLADTRQCVQEILVSDTKQDTFTVGIFNSHKKIQYVF